MSVKSQLDWAEKTRELMKKYSELKKTLVDENFKPKGMFRKKQPHFYKPKIDELSNLISRNQLILYKNIFNFSHLQGGGYEEHAEEFIGLVNKLSEEMIKKLENQASIISDINPSNFDEKSKEFLECYDQEVALIDRFGDSKLATKLQGAVAVLQEKAGQIEMFFMEGKIWIEQNRETVRTAQALLATTVLVVGAATLVGLPTGDLFTILRRVENIVASV